MSWTYYPELLATPVPRYTSYPTAAEFNDKVGARELEKELASVRPDQPISLYVHIPYCHEICWYCGCNTGAANRAGRLGAPVRRVRTACARLESSGSVSSQPKQPSVML